MKQLCGSIVILLCIWKIGARPQGNQLNIDDARVNRGGDAVNKPPSESATANASDDKDFKEEAIVFIGGENQPLEYYPSHETIDGPWSNRVKLRAGLGAARLGDNIYITGGSGTFREVDIYNWKTKKFSRGPDMNQSRQHHAVAAINGKIYVCGGMNESFQFTDTCESLDPKENEWKPVPSSKASRWLFASASTPERLYLVGGYDGSVSNSVEYFDVRTQTWNSIPNFPNTRRSGYVAAAMGKYLYLCGGSGLDYSYLKTCDRYNSDTNQWEPIANMTTPRHNFMLTPFKDELWAIGGYSNKDEKTVEVYNPSTNQWRLLSPIPYGRVGFKGIVVGPATPK